MDPQTTSTQSVCEKLDIAWSHCTESKGPDGKKQFRCLHCGITYKGGGINRIKQHLAGIRGNIASCMKVPHDIRYQMQENLKEIGKKKQQAQEELEHNTAVFVDEYMEEERGSSSLPKSQSSDAHHEGTNKGKRKLDNIEKFFAPRTRAGSQPSLKSVVASKEAIHHADLAVARWFYDSCIPLNAINSNFAQKAIDAIGAIGPGYKLPSYYKLRVNLLRDCKEECKLLIDSYKRSWSEIGYTLMADGWTDNRNRTLINFLVYYPRGPHNVVQLVTDNAANYKKAGELLHERFGNIYWSPCSAHCLNLILKDIGNMSHIQDLAQRASKVTIFVYNHVFVLAWLRKRYGWKEIIRPGATRFATIFITLKSMADHKLDLQAFITSKVFFDSKISKTVKGKEVSAIILDNKFWNDCLLASKLSGPLIRLLRIVDSDEKPSLGFLYDGMYKARKAIKLMFRNAKRMYKPYTNIHCAAYFLNPHFQYDKENFCQKAEVMQGLIELIGNKDICPKSTATMNEPDEWWKMFGSSAPNLQKLAVRILSQTSSSSGCERNWSVFEQIHTKRRNHLEHQRLNDLVFVRYNLNLRHRNYDPLDYTSIEMVDFWVLDEEPVSELILENLETEIYTEDVIPVAEELNTSSTKEPLNEEVLDDVGNDNEIISNEDIDAFGGECFDEQGFRDITFDASNLGDDF
ncbi:hypothetical protein KFK09_021538 [Dendrobium nobile]|uniref:BED-type domain-containing protein n=1 Tax=Dendrobium nobile TaxID=94219 RepID=A0A8T3AQ71_DENNO|nr:hypothetical protein KFK09_021538 [Dendrobium nobile]